MTTFIFDWSRANLCGDNTVSALGRTARIAVSTVYGTGDQPWTLGTIAQETALCVPFGAADARLSLTFDAPVANLAFDLFDAETDAAGGRSGASVAAIGPNGQDVPVRFSRHRTLGRSVHIAGPVSVLTVSFHNLPAPCNNTAGIGTIAFRAVQEVDRDADQAAIDIRSLVGTDVDCIRYDAAAPGAGVVTFRDGNTLLMSELDQIIPCFTPGTAIATPKGEVLVENLKVGDRVLTRDNGIQTINWVGAKQIDYRQLKAVPQFRPIAIKRGALGDGLPERDMLVSPGHRMLVVSEFAQLYFGQSEVLVAAKHMLGMKDVDVSPQPYIKYIHFMCDNHEIVLSDGTWSESYQPGDFSLKGFDQDQRTELFALFPELATKEGIAAYGAARRTLSKREAKLLFKG